MRLSLEIKQEEQFQRLILWHEPGIHQWMAQTLKIENEEPVRVEKSVLEGLATILPDFMKNDLQKLIDGVDWDTQEIYYFFT